MSSDDDTHVSDLQAASPGYPSSYGGTKEWVKPATWNMESNPQRIDFGFDFESTRLTIQSLCVDLYSFTNVRQKKLKEKLRYFWTKSFLAFCKQVYSDLRACAETQVITWRYYDVFCVISWQIVTKKPLLYVYGGPLNVCTGIYSEFLPQNSL